MKNSYPAKVPILGRVKMCLDLITEQKLSGKTVIDVGSSFGWLENELKTSGAKLIGVDPVKTAIQFAKKQLGNKATFLAGSAQHIPLKNDYADMVVFFDVLEHVPKGSENLALREINRILKKRGQLLLTTPNNHWLSNLLDPAWYVGHRHYKEVVLRKLLTDNGFKINSVKNRGNIWNCLYLIWLYVVVRLFGPNTKVWTWLESKEDQDYKKSGFVTLIVVAEKL